MGPLTSLGLWLPHFHLEATGHSKEEEEDIRRGERGGEEGRARETRDLVTVDLARHGRCHSEAFPM